MSKSSNIWSLLLILALVPLLQLVWPGPQPVLTTNLESSTTRAPGTPSSEKGFVGQSRWSVDGVHLGMTSEEVAELYEGAFSVSEDRSMEIEVNDLIVTVNFSPEGAAKRVLGFSVPGATRGASYHDVVGTLGEPIAAEFYNAAQPVVALVYPGNLRAVFFQEKDGSLSTLSIFWLGPNELRPVKTWAQPFSLSETGFLVQEMPRQE